MSALASWISFRFVGKDSLPNTDTLQTNADRFQPCGVQIPLDHASAKKNHSYKAQNNPSYIFFHHKPSKLVVKQ